MRIVTVEIRDASTHKLLHTCDKEMGEVKRDMKEETTTVYTTHTRCEYPVHKSETHRDGERVTFYVTQGLRF